MKSFTGKMAFGFLGMVAVAGMLLAPVASAKPGKNEDGHGHKGDGKHGPPPVVATPYRQVNLVSDISGVARFTDPNLVNPWGIAIVPSNGRVWVSDNGTGVSTIYSKSGTVQSLVVTIAPPAGGTNGAAPTGMILNNTGAFSVSEGTNSGSPLFIWSTEDGTVSGWNPAVDPTNSILLVDNSASNAVYKGIAMATDGSNQFIFVTNFHDGTVEKYGTNLTLVSSFTDTNLPAGYAPFGIQNVNGQLFVTFAIQNAEKHDDVAGPGNGFVDVFDVNGNLVQQFAANGTLNSPWGVALAPSSFGQFGGTLLVGNFGDGAINAFDPSTGAFLGQLTDVLGNVIAIDSLWGLAFSPPPTPAPKHGRKGNDNDDDDVAGQVLYFTAGIGGEGHGLFGKIKPVLKGHEHDCGFEHRD